MKKMITLFMSLVIIISISSCGTTKQQMEGNINVPAAEGVVSVKETDNNNTSMTVKVKHLAEARKVFSGATNYIVWIRPEGSDAYQNVGALQVDKNLEGTHTTTVPYVNFKVLITPEMSSMGQTPTGPAVFEQRVMRQ
jgi:hypothetical protein